MASLKLISTDGSVLGEVQANDAIFDAPDNEILVHGVIVGFQNAKRQGTHKTKTRAEVSGGGIKPFRQKGTGRARQGSSREPHMRGGGIIFGPEPRDYRLKITSRARRQALCSVLSDRVRGERLVVLKGLTVDAPKTKPFAAMVALVAPEGRRTLFVLPELNENAVLSARNMERVTVRTAADVNALDVIGAVRIVVLEEAVAKLEERLS